MNPKKLMPAAAKLNSYSGKTIWSKLGGYADSTIKAVMTKARAAGFEEFDATSHDVPDGSVIGSGSYYRNAEGDILYVSIRYGSTRDSNSFRIEFTPAKKS